MSAVARSKATADVRTRVPYDEYREMPGVRVSDLKAMRKSAKHYQHSRKSPRESTAMALGTAAHTAVLEPDRFVEDHVVWGDKSAGQNVRRGKVWDAFQARAAEDCQTILTIKEAEGATGMRDAIRAFAPAMRYLASGEPEVSIAWKDADTGMMMKGRADWLTHDGGYPVIVGLKTTRDIRPRLFGIQAAQLGYHLQWAAYADAYQAFEGRTPKVIEIVVESAPPYDVGVYLIDSQVIEQGRSEYRDLLAKFAECTATDVWPGCLPEEVRLELPPWAYEQDEDDEPSGFKGARVEEDGDEA